MTLASCFGSHVGSLPKSVYLPKRNMPTLGGYEVTVIMGKKDMLNVKIVEVSFSLYSESLPIFFLLPFCLFLSVIWSFSLNFCVLSLVWLLFSQASLLFIQIFGKTDVVSEESASLPFPCKKMLRKSLCVGFVQSGPTDWRVMLKAARCPLSLWQPNKQRSCTSSPQRPHLIPTTAHATTAQKRRQNQQQKQKHGFHLVSLQSWLRSREQLSERRVVHWNKSREEEQKAFLKVFLCVCLFAFRWQQWAPERQGHQGHDLLLELWPQSPTNTQCVLSSS